MKTGKTLAQLAAEIERQANSKRDFIAPTDRLWMQPPDGDQGLLLRLGDAGGDVGINEIAHDQIASHTGIPARYYDRMRTAAPQLLAQNVNAWFQQEPAKRLVRTMDGTARAFLSDSYRPLENYDLAEAVLPVLLDMKLELISCEITERRLYLKCVDQAINRDIPKGRRMGDGTHTIFDTCAPALVISNSEVGMGMLSIESGVWTKACTNLAVFAQSGMKRRHVGSRFDLATDGIAEMLASDTRAATDKALWLQVRDVVRGAFDEARFDAQIARIAETTERKIEADPVKVIDFSARKFGWTDGEKGSVLRHLIEGADLSQYGLHAAITRTAEDLASYDRATEFEHLGAQVIELKPSEWREIAQAPAMAMAA